MAYAPAITVYTDPQPCPRAEVLFSALDPAATSITVWRQARGRKFRVRGAVNASVGGAFSRIDTEIPFNVPVDYWAEMFDAAGISLGMTDTTTTTCWVDVLWIHNPLDPQNAIRADFVRGAMSSLSRSTEGNVYYPQGRRVGVVISGQRRGLEGVNLNIVVFTEDEANKFQTMLGGYDSNTVPVLCFRKPTNLMRIPSPFFVSVMDAKEGDFNYFNGGETLTYELQGDEVSPPAEGIIVPLLTRADIAAYYQTRQDVADDNETRLAVSRRYDLAGSAS